MENIDVKKVKFFGIDVEETFYKNGKFKSFQKKEWVKTNKKVHVDVRISEIRKLFDDVVLINKKEHLKRKENGKVVKAISKTYEVIEKGTRYIPEQKFKQLMLCNKKRAIFEYKDKNYYFVIDKVYREGETNDYFLVDDINQKFVETGYNSITNTPTKIKLLNYKKDYFDNL